MTDNATDKKYLCSQLAKVRWESEAGEERSEVANLEEIWGSGASLLLETRLLSGTRVTISVCNLRIEAKVKCCQLHELGYFAEVVFASGYRWSLDSFKPKHLLDPAEVLEKKRKEHARSALVRMAFC